MTYLTDAKRKYSHILWINLREEVVLEGNEQTYTLREVGSLEQQIVVPVMSPEQLEVRTCILYLLFSFPCGEALVLLTQLIS